MIFDDVIKFSGSKIALMQFQMFVANTVYRFYSLTIIYSKDWELSRDHAV